MINTHDDSINFMRPSAAYKCFREDGSLPPTVDPIWQNLDPSKGAPRTRVARTLSPRGTPDKVVTPIHDTLANLGPWSDPIYEFVNYLIVLVFQSRIRGHHVIQNL